MFRFVVAFRNRVKGSKSGLTMAMKQRIVSLYADGWSMAKVAAFCNVSKSTVSYNVHKQVNFQTLDRRPGGGRQRITTSRDDSRILREVRKDRRVSVHAIKHDLQLEEVSVPTIRLRIITESGEFKSYRATRKLFKWRLVV